ncbi:hypothetical protein INR49_002484 [Caranx melampygus]|nr:hypothetical protein INR49_002484 [Caranx melampygus]
MSDIDFNRPPENILNGCGVASSCNNSYLIFHNTSFNNGLDIFDDGSPWLRIVISVVYFVVATAGVLGNLLVIFLLYSTHTITTGTINFFVFNLALADLLFSLTLPFWAVETALDYSWPFSLTTCKAVSLLTAMSLTRYCYVATALKPSTSLCTRSCTSPVASAFIWAGALIAAAPRAVFADLSLVGSDTACLLRFPDGTAWLGINQLLRVVLGFLLPYGTIIFSYLLLLRFLCRHKLKGSNSRRKADISKSVAVVVLSFCACWFPYNVLTLWGALIQLDIVDISPSFFLAQTYFFPLANCLAFASSCFNPVIYCLLSGIIISVGERLTLHYLLSHEGMLGQVVMSGKRMEMSCGGLQRLIIMDKNVYYSLGSPQDKHLQAPICQAALAVLQAVLILLQDLVCLLFLRQESLLVFLKLAMRHLEPFFQGVYLLFVLSYLRDEGNKCLSTPLQLPADPGSLWQNSSGTGAQELDCPSPTAVSPVVAAVSAVAVAAAVVVAAAEFDVVSADCH